MTHTPFHFKVASAAFGYLFFLTPFLFSECSPAFLEFESTYQQIVSSALELKSAESDVAAREAGAWQAGLYPNPEFTVGYDNFVGGARCEDSEFYVELTQPFELGGKRSARIEVAEADRCIAFWNREIRKNQLFGEVLHAFINIAVAQERYHLSEAQHRVAIQALSCANAKTLSGRTSSIESKKAEVTCRAVKLLLARRQTALSLAKKQLLALWDCNPPCFDGVEFPLYQLECPPPLSTLCQTLENHPEIGKAEAEVIRAQNIHRFERTLRVPDIAVQVNMSTERFNRKPSFGFEIDIPLPIFNRNQGNICRAMNEFDEAVYNQMEISLRRRSLLTALHEEWEAAYVQAVELRENLLPPAAESYDLARQGYEEGKFDYLDLLDARNTLFDIQQQYLDAIEMYHHKRADVLTLTKSY